MTADSPETKNRGSWRSDFFATKEVALQRFFLVGWASVILMLLVMTRLLSCSTSQSPTVIIYAAQDQVYSEPILEQFTKRTGIKVRAVYDSEAVKTVGLANRLLAERARPQCDVFWGNEELRTRQLAAENVFRETNGWAAFGHRSRRIVINTNLIAVANAPKNLLELTNAMWRGKVALAYPLFGTTATHFLALRQHWGATSWLAWCRHLQQNDPFLVDGNSVVVNLVGRGEAAVGLTDSDDIAAGQRNGLPIIALPFGAEGLLIPNTVGVVRGGPNPAAAQELYTYLQRPEIAQQLVKQNALESASSAAAAPGLTPDWNKLLDDLDIGLAELRKVFLR
jgi:iron(III) transport system substrate-binding protein